MTRKYFAVLLDLSLAFYSDERLVRNLLRQKIAIGTTVIIIIIRMELNPVILILSSTFRARMLSVTRAIDKPKESTILSMIFIRLKKTSVQAKPGIKKTKINPRIARTMGMRSRKGRTKSNSDPSISGVTFPM